MAINIESFSNVKGGNSVFKAFTHPTVLPKLKALSKKLGSIERLAIFDPLNLLTSLNEFLPFEKISPTHIYVQKIERLSEQTIGCENRPIDRIDASQYDAIFIAAYDTGRLQYQIQHLLNDTIKVITLDDIKIDDALISNPKNYLDPLNFATNYAFFRDEGGLHTRVVTGNYWSAYGAQNPYLWLCLIGENGKVMKSWTQELPPANGLVVIDSKQVRKDHGFDEFCGQLFIHVINPAGHDIVKYALDTYQGNNKIVSCTHDANAWPANLYAGLPAPDKGEEVIFWLQNSQPVEIPKGEVSFNLMGHKSTKAILDEKIPAYGTKQIKISEMMPDVKWPQQIEVVAGKYFVRPRYEIVSKKSKKRCIAHVNVERTDLDIDPNYMKIQDHIGKGIILPAPILPQDQFESFALPTPMSTAQNFLPLNLSLYSPTGQLLHEEKCGALPRDHATYFDVSKTFKNVAGKNAYGHMEFTYAADQNMSGIDGWLHALFRYKHKALGHMADTSFGGHLFNMLMTYKNQPHNYTGPPPGLSTRLFLRMDLGHSDTHCHLIYPASKPWHKKSGTSLALHNGNGEKIAERKIEIACSGSYYFRVKATFNEDELSQAGAHPYVLIRDTTCRLFGYHGLIQDDEAFCLDHMFGF